MNGQNSRAKQQIAAALGGAPSPFPDGRPDPARSLASMAADLHRSEQAANSAARQKLLSALKETWPAQLAKTAYEAATLPGDVYAGRVNPMSDEGIGRSFELAGLMTLGAGAMPAGKNELRAGIKAYHGSPHDFDRFDMSKIGTGEGAQAYGHGLYFAGNEGVAKGYRDALSRGIDDTGLAVRIDGRIVSDPTRDQLHAARFGIDSAAQTIKRQIEGARPKLATASTVDELGIGVSERELAQMGIDELTRRLDEVQRLSGRIEMAPAGRMYEVELNTTPDRLLDWDKPLYQQSPYAQGVLKELGMDTAPKGEWTMKETSPGRWTVYNVWGERSGTFKDETKARALVAENTNRHNAGGVPLVYQRLGGNHVYSRAGMDAGEASAKLRERGIDGIQYLDAGSRAAGDGSRNYVMFNDKLINILRKYGVATAAALPAAGLAELGITAEEARRSM